jgi:hypothetical protein
VSTVLGNLPHSGANVGLPISLHGLNLGPIDLTPSALFSSIAPCSTLSWTSSTFLSCFYSASAQTAPLQWVSSTVRLGAEAGGTLTAAMLYDAPVLSCLAGNIAARGSGLLMITGFNFGMSATTPTVILGQTDVSKYARWLSSTSMRLDVPDSAAIVSPSALGKDTAVAVYTSSVLASATGTGSMLFSFDTVRCVMSSWTAWSLCTCGVGSVYRSREYVSPPEGGGDPCGVVETAPCNAAGCPVDCAVDTQPCAATSTPASPTGGPTSMPAATESVYLVLAGTPTDFSSQVLLSLTAEIATQLALPLSSVTISAVSAGSVRITLLLPQSAANALVALVNNGGLSSLAGFAVQGVSLASAAWTTSVACVVGMWSAWTACSLSCGSGITERARPVFTPPQGLAAGSCPSLSEQLGCNTQGCPVDCSVALWSPWSACSAACNSGIQARSRTVTTAAALGGTTCPAISEEKVCMAPTKCGANADCATFSWTSWTACPVSCAGSIASRVRTVISPQAGTGLACGTTTQSQPCNANACPTDCLLSAWTLWSSCRCTSPTQSRSRVVLAAPLGGGQACAETFAVQPCVPVSCDVAVVSTVAGSAQAGGKDGAGGAALFDTPVALAVDETARCVLRVCVCTTQCRLLQQPATLTSGPLTRALCRFAFVADLNNSVIRKIDLQTSAVGT